MNEFREGTYPRKARGLRRAPLKGTELSTPRGGIEHNPGLFPFYRGLSIFFIIQKQWFISFEI